MKKKLWITLHAAVFSLLVLAGCSGAANTDNNTVVPQTGSAAVAANTENYIGEDEAKKIALEDAKQKESDTTALQVYLDEDADGDDPAAYDVEFFVGNTEYDYEIDASSGEIISRDIDDAAPSGTVSKQTNADGYIGKAKAKRIALKDAGIKKADADAMHVALDYEDDRGTVVYDVEFYSGTTEYDYEIDAKTGDILSKDQDAEGIDRSNQIASEQNLISKTAARNKALNHAGLKKSEVTGLRTELDYDDGAYKYEVEFYHERTEYSYEINAVSGQIISYESEYDD